MVWLPLLQVFLEDLHTTTYSEVTGAVALTKIVDPRVLRIAAVNSNSFFISRKGKRNIKNDTTSCFRRNYATFIWYDCEYWN